MSERDYVLGTHDAEIERLGMQHRVWRARALDAWLRAGVRAGQTVIDLGAGPGYASLDLAETVGPNGRVIAVERSRRFLDALEDNARRRGYGNITTIEADVVNVSFGEGVADAAWCRWVLSFVREPKTVVAHLARALKPRGIAVFHEYFDYGTWRIAPRSAAFERFVGSVSESIRADGGFVDSALALPHALVDLGFEIVATKPIIDIVPPGHPLWQWPASFVALFLDRLVAAGQLTSAEAEETRKALASAEADPHSLMSTPMVLEVIARKL